MRALKGNLLHNSLKELHNSFIIRIGFVVLSLNSFFECDRAGAVTVKAL